MVDVKGGNSLMYLPLDKIMERSGAAATPRFGDAGSAADQAPAPGPVRDTTRGRRSR